MLNNLLNQLPKGIIRMLQVEMINQLCDHFGVGVALEFKSLVLKENLHLLIIGNDAVVHNDEGVVLVRPLRMGIHFARNSVRRPTGVCNSAMHLRNAIEVQFRFAYTNERRLGM